MGWDKGVLGGGGGPDTFAWVLRGGPPNVKVRINGMFLLKSRRAETEAYIDRGGNVRCALLRGRFFKIPRWVMVPEIYRNFRARGFIIYRCVSEMGIFLEQWAAISRR